MANITDLWMFTLTSSTPEWAGSDAALELQLITTGKDLELKTASQQTEVNGISQVGGAAQFHWSEANGDWSSGQLTDSDILSLNLEIVGPDADNAWLPSSIFIVRLDDAGIYALLSANGAWNQDNCFSTQPDDCTNSQPSYDLPLIATALPV